MLRGLGHFLGGYTDQKGEERDREMREQEQKQLRELRQFQLDEARRRKEVADRIAAVPTQEFAGGEEMSPQYFRGIDPSLNDEQAQAFADYARQNPQWGGQAVAGLRRQTREANLPEYERGLPAEPMPAVRGYTDSRGRAMVTDRAPRQRSYAEVAMERAQILASSGRPEDLVTANQLMGEAFKQVRDAFERDAMRIYGDPRMTPEQKAAALAGLYDRERTLPGRVQILPMGENKFAVQYIGEDGTPGQPGKPSTLEEIFENAISGLSFDMYARINTMRAQRRQEGRDDKRLELEGQRVGIADRAQRDTAAYQRSMLSQRAAEMEAADRRHADTMKLREKELESNDRYRQALSQYYKNRGDAELRSRDHWQPVGADKDGTPIVFNRADGTFRRSDGGKVQDAELFRKITGDPQLRSDLEQWNQIEAELHKEMVDPKEIHKRRNAFFQMRGYAPPELLAIAGTGINPFTKKPFTAAEIQSFNQRFPKTPLDKMFPNGLPVVQEAVPTPKEDTPSVNYYDQYGIRFGNDTERPRGAAPGMGIVVP